MNIKYLLLYRAHDRQSINISDIIYEIFKLCLSFKEMMFHKIFVRVRLIYTKAFFSCLFFLKLQKSMQSQKANQDKPYNVSKKSDLIKIMTSMKLCRSGRLDSHAFCHVAWFAVCITNQLPSPIVATNMQPCIFYLKKLTSFFACFILTYILDCELTIEVVMVHLFPIQLWGLIPTDP